MFTTVLVYGIIYVLHCICVREKNIQDMCSAIYVYGIRDVSSCICVYGRGCAQLFLCAGYNIYVQMNLCVCAWCIQQYQCTAYFQLHDCARCGPNRICVLDFSRCVSLPDMCTGHEICPTACECKITDVLVGIYFQSVHTVLKYALLEIIFA